MTLFIYYITEKECTIIRNMPIFPSFHSEIATTSDNMKYISIGDRDGQSGSTKNTHTTTTTTNTSSTTIPYMTITDFKHLPATILPGHILYYTELTDLQLYQQLQVTVLTRTQYFRQIFLPNIGESYAKHPIDTINTVLIMLEEIKVLCESDNSFMSMLSTVAFIPSATSTCTTSSTTVTSDGGTTTSGDATTSTTTNNSTTTTTPTYPPLHRACDLFDPTNTELLALLDPQYFPNTTLLPLLKRPDLLALLRELGLQTTLHWSAIVDCAR